MSSRAWHWHVSGRGPWPGWTTSPCRGRPTSRVGWQALGQAPHTLWPRSLHPHTPQIQKKPQAPLKAQGQAWAPLTHSATHSSVTLLSWAGFGPLGRAGPETQCLPTSNSPTTQLSKKALSDRGGMQGLIKWALTTNHSGSRPFPPFNPSGQELQFPYLKNGLMTSCDLEPQTKVREAWGQSCSRKGRLWRFQASIQVRRAGPALAGQQEGLEPPCFGWQAGQHMQGTPCGIFGTAPHFPCSPQASRSCPQL